MTGQPSYAPLWIATVPAVGGMVIAMPAVVVVLLITSVGVWQTGRAPAG